MLQIKKRRRIRPASPIDVAVLAPGSVEISTIAEFSTGSGNPRGIHVRLYFLILL